MHSKTKGSIGHSAIVCDLLKQNFNIFIEFGDLSKIDIIAEKNFKLYKIQVKALNPMKSGSLWLKPYKSGPNYFFRYNKNDVDIFAIYSLQTNEIGYVNSDDLLKTKSGMSFRIRLPKNNQKIKVKYLSDYRNIKELI
jgi:hypothetical protein